MRERASVSTHCDGDPRLETWCPSGDIKSHDGDDDCDDESIRLRFARSTLGHSPLDVVSNMLGVLQSLMGRRDCWN